MLHERLAVRRQGDRVLDPGHRVADPYLDRPPAADAAECPTRCACSPRYSPSSRAGRRPPRSPRSRGSAAAGPSAGRPRRPICRVDARPGRLAAPEGRARRQREQQRRAATSEPVHDLDRLLRVVHGDVDVEPEDQLAPRHVLHLVDERAVPVTGRDPLRLEQAERVRAGRADAQRLLRRDRGDVLAQLAELAVDVRGACRQTGVAISSTDCISSGFMCASSSCPAIAARNGVDVLYESSSADEEHVLLLDSEGVQISLPRRRGRGRCRLRRSRLPVMARGVDLLHQGRSIERALEALQLTDSWPAENVAVAALAPGEGNWGVAAASGFTGVSLGLRYEARHRARGARRGRGGGRSTSTSRPARSARPSGTCSRMRPGFRSTGARRSRSPGTLRILSNTGIEVAAERIALQRRDAVCRVYTRRPSSSR